MPGRTAGDRSLGRVRPSRLAAPSGGSLVLPSVRLFVLSGPVWAAGVRRSFRPAHGTRSGRKPALEDDACNEEKCVNCLLPAVMPSRDVEQRSATRRSVPMTPSRGVWAKFGAMASNVNGATVRRSAVSCDISWPLRVSAPTQTKYDSPSSHAAYGHEGISCAIQGAPKLMAPSIACNNMET